MLRLVPLLVLTLACTDGLEPITRITKGRIIGVHASVRGDETRTSALPGETLDITLITTQPGAAMTHTWDLVVCRPAPTQYDFRYCAEEPIARFTQREPTLDAPAFAFTMPDDVEEDLLFTGAVCLGGVVPEVWDIDDPQPCAGEGVGRIVAGSVRRQRGEPNRNPTIEAIMLDGSVWTNEGPSHEACAGMGLPEVRLDVESLPVIEVVLTPDSREWYTRDGEEDIEDLPVAFFATERGLTKLYSVVTDERPMADVELDVDEIVGTDRETLGPEGRSVRFDIVVRDDRGGVDHATRTLCLLPASLE